MDSLQARKRFFPSTKVLGSWSVINYPQESRRVKIAILHNKFFSKSFRFPVSAFSVATVLAAKGNPGQQDGRPIIEQKLCEILILAQKHFKICQQNYITVRTNRLGYCNLQSFAKTCTQPQINSLLAWPRRHCRPFPSWCHRPLDQKLWIDRFVWVVVPMCEFWLWTFWWQQLPGTFWDMAGYQGIDRGCFCSWNTLFISNVCGHLAHQQETLKKKKKINWLLGLLFIIQNFPL